MNVCMPVSLAVCVCGQGRGGWGGGGARATTCDLFPLPHKKPVPTDSTVPHPHSPNVTPTHQVCMSVYIK